jgi:hypothetical protein
MYELHFPPDFRKKFREDFDLPDRSGLFLGNDHARFLSILLRQETLFLDSPVVCVTQESRHCGSAAA